jgi:uncharacterized integral membrane protein
MTEGQERVPISRVKLLISGLLGLLVMIVMLQNTAAVETKLLFLTIRMPRAVLLFGTTLLGFILGGLLSRRVLKYRNRG